MKIVMIKFNIILPPKSFIIIFNETVGYKNDVVLNRRATEIYVKNTLNRGFHLKTAERFPKKVNGQLFQRCFYQCA